MWQGVDLPGMAGNSWAKQGVLREGDRSLLPVAANVERIGPAKKDKVTVRVKMGSHRE